MEHGELVLKDAPSCPGSTLPFVKLHSGNIIPARHVPSDLPHGSSVSFEVRVIKARTVDGVTAAPQACNVTLQSSLPISSGTVVTGIQDKPLSDINSLHIVNCGSLIKVERGDIVTSNCSTAPFSRKRQRIAQRPTQKQSFRSFDERDQVTFTYGQQLIMEEDLVTEFKSGISLSESQVENYVRQNFPRPLGAFLNSEGGYIFLGIHDKGYVSGIRVSRNTRDRISRAISAIFSSFTPSVGPSLYRIEFPTVKGGSTPDLHLLRIKVTRPISVPNYYLGNTVHIRCRACIRSLEPLEVEARVIEFTQNNFRRAPTRAALPISISDSLFVTLMEEGYPYDQVSRCLLSMRSKNMPYDIDTALALVDSFSVIVLE